jgi:hypothetical protein
MTNSMNDHMSYNYDNDAHFNTITTSGMIHTLSTKLLFLMVQNETS